MGKPAIPYCLAAAVSSLAFTLMNTDSLEKSITLGSTNVDSSRAVHHFQVGLVKSMMTGLPELLALDRPLSRLGAQLMRGC